MRSFIHKKILAFTTFSLVAVSVFSQTDRFAYAITDVQKDGASWNVLRKINTQSGEISEVLLDGSSIKQAIYDAGSKKQLTEIAAEQRYANLSPAAFSTGVAALSYDKRNNRLYYTPMFIDQMRYIDLKTMKVFYDNDEPFSKAGDQHNDEGKIMTRMAIAEDGNGYAISNDANTFVRFSTGKKMEITNLGPLVDDPSNKAVSIHNRCTCYGGDMIADDAGNLIIITNRTYVFSVNIESRIAKHIGTISNLPNEFTTNGAAINEKGDLLVSSAIYSKSYFTVNTKTWVATPFEIKDGAYRSSDLANGNVLQTKPSSNTPTIPTLETIASLGTDKVQLYPNPVSQNKVTLQFSKMKTGDYTLELTDVMGRQVMQQRISIGAEEQVENINISAGTARGIYLIKMIDRTNKSVFSQKLVLQ